jgi:predicted metal-dependent hydrolase
MTGLREQLVIDDVSFEIRRSDRRRTIAITVDRDGTLLLHAPADCPVAQVEAVARQRQLWVHSKLAEKQRLATSRQPKSYVPGEGFYYLGRSYRLSLVPDAQPVPLRLYRGRFELRRSDAEHGRKHFVTWYRRHAHPWLSERIDRFADRIGVQPQSVRVLSLGNRWGSCTPAGRLSFHWRTILLPPTIAEYAVAHELTHLREGRHSAAFWHVLDRVLPDYAQRQQWLAEHGWDYDL